MVSKKSAPLSNSRSKSPPKKTSRPVRRDKNGLSIPPLLFANVSPHSVGGLSMFDYGGAFDADIISNFMSEDDVIRRSASTSPLIAVTVRLPSSERRGLGDRTN